MDGCIMPVRIYGTSGYVELAVPSTATSQVLTLPTDSLQPGLVLISNTTFNAASSVSVNNCFSSTYENYRIVISATSSYTGTNVPATRIRFRSGGVDNTVNNYVETLVYSTNTAGPTRAYNQAVTNPAACWIYDIGGVMVMDIASPFTSNRSTLGTYSAWGQGTVANIMVNGSISYYANASFDGFTLTPDNGNITGTLRIYGYRNS